MNRNHCWTVATPTMTKASLRAMFHADDTEEPFFAHETKPLVSWCRCTSSARSVRVTIDLTDWLTTRHVCLCLCECALLCACLFCGGKSKLSLGGNGKKRFFAPLASRINFSLILDTRTHTHTSLPGAPVIQLKNMKSHLAQKEKKSRKIIKIRSRCFRLRKYSVEKKNSSTPFISLTQSLTGNQLINSSKCIFISRAPEWICETIKSLRRARHTQCRHMNAKCKIYLCQTRHDLWIIHELCSYIGKENGPNGTYHRHVWLRGEANSGGFLDFRNFPRISIWKRRFHCRIESNVRHELRRQNNFVAFFLRPFFPASHFQSFVGASRTL